MRWLFLDSNDQRETAERARTLAAIDHWWATFSQHQSDLKALFAGQKEWDLAAWMQSTLQSVAPELMWEFGPGKTTASHRLVITPEADRHLRPLVNELLRRAPELPEWEFYGHRLAESFAEVTETVRGICGGDISQALVEARRDRHRRIDLTYYCPHCEKTDDEQSQFAAFVATEALLGEALLDRWIGNIKIEPLQPQDTEQTARAWPLARLKPTMEAIVGSIVDQLPGEPSYAFVPKSKWNGYELKPEQAADYPGRTDLYAAISGRPDVFEANHNGAVFYSEVHSKCGELFCYLKIDGQGRPDQERSQWREAVQHALDDRMIPGKIGCVIGGGTGLRYSYIDLALVDVPQALPILQRIASDFFFPPASWLLFCDDELAAEWVGLHAKPTRPLL
jgi:hypothetical protein